MARHRGWSTWALRCCYFFDGRRRRHQAQPGMSALRPNRPLLPRVPCESQARRAACGRWAATSVARWSGRAPASCSSAPAAGPATAGGRGLIVCGRACIASVSGPAHRPELNELELLQLKPVALSPSLAPAAASVRCRTTKRTRQMETTHGRWQKGRKQLQTRLHQGRPPAGAAMAAAGVQASRRRPAEARIKVCHLSRSRRLLPPPSGGGTPACALHEA